MSIITVWKVSCGHEDPLVGVEEWLFHFFIFLPLFAFLTGWL